MVKKKGARKLYLESLRKFFNWFGSNFVIIMFAIIVIGFSLASMSHVFTFAKFYNLPFFAGMFMVAMELGLIGTTIIFSIRDMLAIEERDPRPWWKRFLSPKKDPVLSARRFGNLAVFVIFASLYVINVFSAYYYYSMVHAETFAKTAVFMSTLFFITISPEWLMKILAHIAAGILPFGAYTFGKMVALHIAQKRQEKDAVGKPIEPRSIPVEPPWEKPKEIRKDDKEGKFWERIAEIEQEEEKAVEEGDEVVIEKEEPGAAEETVDEEPFRGDI